MSKLKITGTTNLPSWAIDGSPITVAMLLTDAANDQYAFEVDMLKGFNAEDFKNAMQTGFEMCDATPVSVHIERVTKIVKGGAKCN